MRHRRRSRFAPTSLFVVAVTLAISVSVLAMQSAVGRSASQTDVSIHKIKHIIMIMQENRSFDTYFGTYPGADGILEALEELSHIKY